MGCWGQHQLNMLIKLENRLEGILKKPSGKTDCEIGRISITRRILPEILRIINKHEHRKRKTPTQQTQEEKGKATNSNKQQTTYNKQQQKKHLSFVIYPWTNQPLWPTWKAVAYRCALRDLHTLGEKILAISTVIFGPTTHRYVRYENVYCVISAFSDNYAYIISYRRSSCTIHEFKGKQSLVETKSTPDIHLPKSIQVHSHKSTNIQYSSSSHALWDSPDMH